MVNKKVILARKIYAEACLLEATETECEQNTLKMMFEHSYKRRMELMEKASKQRTDIKKLTTKIEKWQKEHDQITE